MGVLDDAIRDHLELKRRRGADPAEVERAEREALGPVRRGPEPVADDATVAEAMPYDDQEIAAPPLAGGPVDELEDDELWEDEFEPEWEDEPAEEHPPLGHEPAPDAPAAPPPPLEPGPAALEPEPAPSPEPHPAVPEPHPAEPHAVDPHPAAPEPHPIAPEPHPAPPAPTGDETVEYRVEDALDHEGVERTAGEGEDVLEETPEFLQDTPDHDRLWFEQRPPRDFDFDG